MVGTRVHRVDQRGRGPPLFRGHYQPRVPGDLGFYDLRLPETRAAQADLAAYGVKAFCYWHYWFGGGRRLLERPFDEVLHSGEPDFPFCLGWANQTWSGIWHGAPGRVLVEQTYPGEDDHRAHFEAVLPAFTIPAISGWTAARCSTSSIRPGFPKRNASSTCGARGPSRPGSRGSISSLKPGDDADQAMPTSTRSWSRRCHRPTSGRGIS